MDKELFYAVNPSGQGNIFVSRPVRGERNWMGVMEPCFSMVLNCLESEGFHFPSLKWSDEPAVIKMSVNLPSIGLKKD